MESMTDNSVFEGMFVRALTPTGQFMEDLRAAGYDPAKPKIRYATSIWRDSLEVARRHCYPEVAPDAGLRLLGQRFIEGFFETIAGRFMAVAMPLIGAAAVIKRIPRYWAAVRTGVSVSIQQEGERCFRVTYRDTDPAPEFYAGIIEGAGKYTRTTNVVAIPSRDAQGFELLITF